MSSFWRLITGQTQPDPHRDRRKHYSHKEILDLVGRRLSCQDLSRLPVNRLLKPENYGFGERYEIVKNENGYIVHVYCQYCRKYVGPLTSQQIADYRPKA